MVRQLSTLARISAAISSADKSQIPEGCVVEVYYDSKARCWYAQYVDMNYKQQGNLGFAKSAYDAVLSLQENN